jgi:hypothetical protein
MQVRTIKIRVKVFGTDGEESSSSAHVHTVRHGHTKAVRISLQSHLHSYSKEIRSKGERLLTRDTEREEKGGEQERQRRARARAREIEQEVGEGGRERNRLDGAGKRVTHRPFCGQRKIG